MLVGAVATLVAALATSVVAPGPEVTDVVSAMIGR
jgi:hypothetical protein